jgi:magnesium transporter
MRAYLYDAEGVDQEYQLDALDVAELGEGRLLWVDVDAVEDEVRAAAKLFGLEEETVTALLEEALAPALYVHQEYFHVTVTEVHSDADNEFQAVVLDCVAGPNWVLTCHHEPVEFLRTFNDRFRGESNLGRFGSAEFVSALLNEQLLSYGQQLEPIITEIDHVEQLILRDRVDEDELLRRLVSINQRITRLRRYLAPHTEIYERLAQPNLSELLPEASPEGQFAALIRRLERTLDSLDTTRQTAAASLDLYTTLVAHGTNKVIKLLTVVSVTLLPPTLLTGFLGMNDVPNSLRGNIAFWVSAAVMLTLVITVLSIARRRGWL